MHHYGEEGVQYHTGLRHGAVGRYVILPGDPKRCETIAAYLDAPRLLADVREYTTYTGLLDGVQVGVTSTGIGGPSAAIAMEELVRCGADTFVRVGTCGGMALSVKGGDLVIANGAVRMEGTGRAYAPIAFPAVADFTVTRALADAAAELGLPFHLGVVHCKDSFFGQHEPEKKPVAQTLLREWEACCRLGCLGSEMESAALFVVAAALRVRVGTCLLAMANQERERAGLENPVVHDPDPAIRTAIAALRRLIRADAEDGQ